MSKEQIQSRVIKALRMEAALNELFGVEITDAMLQKELDRMARNTKAPARLRELFDALDNHPVKIAECMARPFLVEQKLRYRYSWDDRFHGEIDAQVKAGLLESHDPALHTDPVGRTERVVFLRRQGSSPIPEQGPDDGGVEPIILDSEEYDRVKARLGRSSAHSDRRSGLRETSSAFIDEKLLNQTNDRLEVNRTVWTKTDFNKWWEENAERWSAISPAVVSIEVQLPRVGNSVGSDDYENPDFTPPDTWLVGRTLPARAQHTAIWTGTEMIVWGGSSGTGGYLNTGDRYDPTTDSWRPTSTIDAPLGRYAHAAVWTGSEMIVWGGEDLYDQITGGRYDPTTDLWVATSTIDTPLGRTAHTAVWTGSEMIVWGGNGKGVGRVNSGGRYDPSTNSWEATSIAGAPSERNQHTAIWTGSEMVVWGGYYGELNTGGRYDPSTDLWQATSTVGAPIGRYLHTAVWTGSEMIVWGGSTDVNPYMTNTGGRYNPATDSWTATGTTDAPNGRNHQKAVWTGSEMVIWGGWVWDIPAGYYNTGGRYDPATDQWEATSTIDAPNGRRIHTAIWTGSEMIVWGGYDGGDPFNTGGRYDPAANQWAATHLGYSPTNRSGHTAVWTGSEMFVWGGSADSVRVDTGGRYDPVIDGWTATTTTDAPSARDRHTAVWTGTEVIVWGGDDNLPGPGNLDTGGRYDPVADLWVATSTIDAPEEREDHTAVWTGNEMIVWGGDGDGLLDTGGRYDPGTDLWVATGTTNAPEERERHTAIWTGSEMIVWGGDSGGPLDTGGCYDPATDLWRDTSPPLPEPRPRYHHTAVWTGDEMIVWGGYGGGVYRDTGGRYDPATNLWQETSTTNAPSMRELHTAVWTGNEMIIWGGSVHNGVPLLSGGRYYPQGDDWQITSTTGTPEERYRHTAVWTGWEMIVWGGFPSSASLGLYYPYGDLIRIFFDGFETGNTLRWIDTFPY